MKRQVIYIFIFAILIISIVLVSSGRFDFNGDGNITISDLQTLAAHFEGKAAYNSTYDLNNDGSVDLFDVVSLAKNVNTSSVSSGVPTPPAVGSVNIVFDSRAGGAQSIQAAGVTSNTTANAAMGAGSHSDNGAGYYVYPVDFTTNYDGLGTHAYRFNWRYEGGYNSTGNETTRCYNMNGEQDASVSLAQQLVEQPLYIQWKMWYGRTATGGGYGNSTISSFNNSHGHKLLIIFRSSGGNAYRIYFGYAGPTNGLSADIAGVAAWTQGDGATLGSISGYLNDTPVDLDKYINKVVTFTLKFSPESSVGAGDGRWQAWIDDSLIWDLHPMTTGAVGFGAQQFGGPTWICPPQDQTQYQYDWVEWRPEFPTSGRQVKDATTPQTGTSTSAVLNKPANVVPGDVILAVFDVIGDMTGSITAPPGFSEILNVPKTNGIESHIFARLADGTEGSTFTFTLGSSVSTWAAHMGRIDDADTSNFPSSLITGTPQTASSTGENVTVPSLTVSPNALLLGVAASRYPGGTMEETSGDMIPTTVNINTGSRKGRSFHQEITAGGNTGSRDFSNGGGYTTNIAGLVAISKA